MRQYCTQAILVATLLLQAAVCRGEALTPVPVQNCFNGAAFSYTQKLEARTSAYSLWHLRYASPVQGVHAANNTIHSEYYLPNDWREGDAPRPGVMVLHILGGDFALARHFSRLLAQQGIPALMMKMPFYGERAVPGGRRAVARDPALFTQCLPQALLDIRRSLDLLESRAEIAPDKLGLLGVSLGGIVGATAAAQDERVRRCVLLLAGGDLNKIVASAHEARELRQMINELSAADQQLIAATLDQVDPLQHAAKLRARAQAGLVLMINAEADEVVPRACTERLAEALGITERVQWQKGMGHYTAMAALPQMMATTTAFFAQDLPATYQVTVGKPTVVAPPAQRMASLLQTIASMFTATPAPGHGHFVELAATLRPAAGKQLETELSWIRGAGGRFRLEGHFPGVKHLALGNGSYPWIGSQRDLVFAGTENPVAAPLALGRTNPQGLLKLNMITGIMTAISMVPETLLHYAEISDAGSTATGPALRLQLKKALTRQRVTILLRFQADGVTPQALEIDLPGGRGMTLLVRRWAVDTVTPDELFAPPRAASLQAVDQSDVHGMFAAVFDYLLELSQ